MNGVLGAFGLIVVFEAAAQEMRGDANDGVNARIEIFGAAEAVNRDVVFFYVVGGTIEIFFADVAESFRDIANAAEGLRVQERVKLSAFGFKLGSR
jgi:hypothetical protein